MTANLFRLQATATVTLIFINQNIWPRNKLEWSYNLGDSIDIYPVLKPSWVMVGSHAHTYMAFPFRKILIFNL